MPDSKFGFSSLQVDVHDVKGAVIKDATVTFKSASRGKEGEIAVRFDDRIARYVAKDVPQGEAVIEVKHGSLQGQTRKVYIGAGEQTELFILAKPGVKTYFREKVEVPVDADSDLVAITMDRKARGNRAVVENLTGAMSLQAEKTPPLAERAGIHLFRTKGVDAPNALARLSEHPLVEHAGAVVSMREKSFTYLTREIVVRLRGHATSIESIARENDYTLVRELPYAPRTYVLRWSRPATLDILDSIAKIAARDDVEWAEPSLAVSPELTRSRPRIRSGPACGTAS